MKKIRKPEKFTGDKEELSPEFSRELKRRLADAHNPVRYAIFSDITGDGRWRLWLDVSGDGYGISIDQATLFKREHVARSVAKAYSERRRNDLLIAKITIRNGGEKSSSTRSHSTEDRTPSDAVHRKFGVRFHY